MIPAKRDFVDFGKCKTTPLVGVENVLEVIMEVVEGSIAAWRGAGLQEVDILLWFRVGPHQEDGLGD
jgi:hypothetical protein